MCTEQNIYSLRALNTGASLRIEEWGGLVQPVRTACLDEVVRCAFSRAREEKSNNHMTTLPRRSSKYHIEVLTDAMKKRYHDQGYAPS